MKLRKLDRRDMTLKIYIALVLTFLAILVLFIAASNRQNIVEHRDRNEAVHRDIEDLICDIIIQRPAASITDGQRKACEGKGTQL